MSATRWDRLKIVFHEALEQPPGERAAWLARACGGDRSLLEEASALLRAHDTLGGFLEAPPEVEVERVADAAGAADQAAEAHGPLWTAGSRVGHYEIVSELGRGGMGVVYLADDTRLGRRVALKSLPPAIARRADLRERLRREARAAATIAHPGVATIYALEEIDGHLLLASEYVRGETLRAVIERGPVPPRLARGIAASVAAALAASHAAGVVHRDLKPENVLVDVSAGWAKVVDFGIALVEHAGGPRLTGTHHVLGTPAYMAPEQLVGAAADARTDLYAFGVVLREMLLGRHPLQRDRHGETAAGWASDLPAGAAPLAAIADRAAQPLPERRYGSADEILADLGGTGAGLDGVASPPSPAAPPFGAAGGTPSRIRWWWEFHQGATSLAYVAILVPVWRARTLIGGSAGRLVFAGAMTAVVLAVFVRCHLWFTSRWHPSDLAWVRAREGRVVHVADWLYVAALLAGSWLVPGEDAWDVALLACAIGVAVAFLVIEPVTERSAFGGTENLPR